MIIDIEIIKTKKNNLQIVIIIIIEINILCYAYYTIL